MLLYIYGKGMTPIEKNVIVVDELGNEYEATYPKRAKGLVKSGRARFINENKICMLCPPKNETEDSNMSENKNTEKKYAENVAEAMPELLDVMAEVKTKKSVDMQANDTLTAKEIFSQICALQKILTESSYHSLHRLEGCIVSICDEENENKNEQVSEVCSAFKMRETTFIKMLEFYQKMYDDCNDENAKKIGLINAAFAEHTNSIKSADLKPEDKFAALGEITDKIAELTERILIPQTVPTTKQLFINEMTRVLKATGASKEDKENAKEILKMYAQTLT